MKKLKFIFLTLLLATGVVFVACEKEELIETEDNDTISTEVINQVELLHFNADDVTSGTIELPDGSVLKSYIIEGDIAMTAEQLFSMKVGNIREKQYRTYNLVSTPQTIDVIGYTGSGNALSTKMQTALQWAVANYNRLNLGLQFNLTFGTNYQYKDIVVYQVSGGAGGMAGFPSGGAPYKWVQIFSGIESYSTNVVEHVITHEMGHCIGLRHTDWATRASCGSNQSEGANPYGAVHIPGTPTGYDANSLMKACFSGSEDGEFGYYDRVALDYLY